MLKTLQLTRRFLLCKDLVIKSTYSGCSTLSKFTNPYTNLNFNKSEFTNDLVIQKRFYASKKLKSGKGSSSNKPKVELSKEEIDSVINYGQLLKDMKHAIEHLRNDYNENLNLRVSPSSFEDINVKTPLGTIKLGEIAQVEIKSQNMYVIDLIDTPEYAKPVFDAVLRSKLNSNPKLEKTTISLPIAKITREHRETLSKTAKLKSELAIKKIRDVESKALRKAKENKTQSKDLVFNVSQHIKYQYEQFSKEANLIRDAKIKEILQE